MLAVVLIVVAVYALQTRPSAAPSKVAHVDGSMSAGVTGRPISASIASMSARSDDIITAPNVSSAVLSSSADGPSSTTV